MKINSLLLSSTDPKRLLDWYVSAFGVKVDNTGPHHVLDFDGFYIMLDSRDDVTGDNPQPGRVILNIDVADARALVKRLDELQATWLSPLEEREGNRFATVIDPDGNYIQLIEVHHM